MSEGGALFRLRARILDAIAEYLDDIAFRALDGNATCAHHEGKGLAKSGLKSGQLVGGGRSRVQSARRQGAGSLTALRERCLARARRAR